MRLHTESLGQLLFNALLWIDVAIGGAHTPGLDKAQKKRLKNGTLFGIELVDSVTRLCAMNLLLHGIGEGSSNPEREDQDGPFTLPVVTKDALAGKHGEYITSCWPIRRSAKRAA